MTHPLTSAFGPRRKPRQWLVTIWCGMDGQPLTVPDEVRVMKRVIRFPKDQEFEARAYACAFDGTIELK